MTTCASCGQPLPADDRERHARLLGLQAEARRLGRDIITGGSGWREGGLYGAVVATTHPYPSALGRRSRNDSWRCHHFHEDDLAALECALAEVRRLAAGGEYEPCSDYPGCQDRDCRFGWPRKLRGETA